MTDIDGVSQETIKQVKHLLLQGNSVSLISSLLHLPYQAIMEIKTSFEMKDTDT